jgi:DNA-binding CsgD family transcriptional regulator
MTTNRTAGLPPLALKERTRVAPDAAGRGAGMSHADAAAVVALSIGVVTVLVLADPKDALGYLLAFPIWIVAKDLGAVAGAVAGLCALLFVVILGTALGPAGYVGCAAVFFGAVAAGARAAQPNVGQPSQRSSVVSLLTARPEITRRVEALSRRELQVLEMIATGAKNSQIAERFVISQNTVKSHVSRILQKLPARNRTEAAFRYIEMYGAPASSANGAAQPVDRVVAADAIRATVSGLPSGDSVALTLQDGRELDVPVLDEVRDRLSVGASAVVYFDQADRPIGWYLPDEEIGVDLRHWAP